MGSRAANDPSVFTITEKAPTTTRDFSWLKAPTSASRGLLHDCENRWIVCSSTQDADMGVKTKRSAL